MIPRDRAFRKTLVAFVPLGGTNIEKSAAQHKDVVIVVIGVVIAATIHYTN
jgi:hypothetical protein